ncbi:MAG: tetratricopeptide repeat protein [Gammaproteobacteria bacterium]
MTTLDDSPLREALQRYESGEHGTASSICEQRIREDTADAPAWALLGLSQLALGDIGKAERCLGRAAILKPGNWRYHLNLGSAQCSAGKPAIAVRTYHVALRLRPDEPDIHFNLGNAYAEMGLLAEAEAAFEQVTDTRPSDTRAWLHLARIQLARNRYGCAAFSSEEALALDRANSEARLILSQANLALGNAPGALNALNALVRKHPDLDDAHWARSRLRLMMGQYHKAWPEFLHSYPDAESGAPHWDGRQALRKSLHIDGRGSVSDVLRWLPQVSAASKLTGPITLQCHADLVPFLEPRLAGIASVVDHNAVVSTDLSATMEMLPALLRASPDPSPFLKPDPERVAHWRTRFAHASSPVVLLAWRGEANGGSFPLRTLAPLIQLKGCRFLALQSLAGEPPVPMDLLDISAEMQSFEDLAAIIAASDLVISADAPAAHLAGAMGHPTGVLLSALHHWSWGCDEQTAPWYRDVLLFRQAAQDDWTAATTALVTHYSRAGLCLTDR